MTQGMDPKQLAILAQATAHDAATLTAAIVSGQDYAPEGAELTFREIHQGIFDYLAEFIAAEVMKAGFPGAEVGLPSTLPPSSSSAQVAPVYGNADATPTPIPGTGSDKDDAKWQEFFNTRDQWWDNRSDKRSPAAADFAHKTRKNERGYPEGLWLNGKFGKAPQWVFEKLGMA